MSAAMALRNSAMACQHSRRQTQQWFKMRRPQQRSSEAHKAEQES